MDHEGGGRGAGHFGRHFGRRVFDHGDVRYVILALLAEKPSYGYELIKAIEERLNGAYSPSPGLIYPTLAMLVELGYVTEENAARDKKLYSLTPEGKEFLAANAPLVEAIFRKIARAAAIHRRADAPQLVRALENLKLALRLKTSGTELTGDQIEAIAAALDDAARRIEQC